MFPSLIIFLFRSQEAHKFSVLCPPPPLKPLSVAQRFCWGWYGKRTINEGMGPRKEKRKINDEAKMREPAAHKYA
jgi:hypothetical protein